MQGGTEWAPFLPELSVDCFDGFELLAKYNSLKKRVIINFKNGRNILFLDNSHVVVVSGALEF